MSDLQVSPRFRELQEALDAFPGSPKDPAVHHPPHYCQHPSGTECIEIAEHFPYNLGNAIKYIWRAGLKDPSDPLTDLKKGLWYIQREVMRLEAMQDARPERSNYTGVDDLR